MFFKGYGYDNSSIKAIVTHKVWFDISWDDEDLGRIEIGLFGKIVPKTVEKFVQLTNNDEGEGYKGSEFYYINEEVLVKGGEITNEDGTIYDEEFDHEYFDDEELDLKHYMAGWLSMANNGTVGGSQFLITTIKIWKTEAQELDGHHVVFGKVGFLTFLCFSSFPLFRFSRA